MLSSCSLSIRFWGHGDHGQWRCVSGKQDSVLEVGGTDSLGLSNFLAPIMGRKSASSSVHWDGNIKKGFDTFSFFGCVGEGDEE